MGNMLSKASGSGTSKNVIQSHSKGVIRQKGKLWHCLLVTATSPYFPKVILLSMNGERGNSFKNMFIIDFERLQSVIAIQSMKFLAFDK